jgi:hypothetical protein
MNQLGKSSLQSMETWALALAGILETLHAAGVFHPESVGAHVVSGLAALFAILRTGLKASEAKSVASMVSKKNS